MLRPFTSVEKLSMLGVALLISLALSWVFTTQLIVPSMTPVIDVGGITSMLTSIITIDGILFGLVTLPITIYRPAVLNTNVKLLYGSALVASTSLVLSVVSSLMSLGAVHSVEFANTVVSQGTGTPIQVPYVQASGYMTFPILALVFSFVFVLVTLSSFVLAIPSEMRATSTHEGQ